MINVPSLADSRHLPLLVVLDGSEYFQAFSALVNALGSYGTMPAMIVAGVDCSEHFTYYTPSHADIPDGTPVPESGRAREYLMFLEEELVPAIEQKFNAAPYTVLFGHSLAGLFTLYAMQTQGSVFDGFIISSPSLWWDSELLTSRLPETLDCQTRLFLSLGNEDETMGGPFSRYLEQLGQTGNVVSESRVFPESSHQQVPFKSFIYGIEFIFKPWAPCDLSSLDSVEAHYRLTGEIYGYETSPPEGILNSQGYRLLGEGRVEEAIEAFSVNRDYHPGSSNVYDSLAEALLCRGDTTGALVNYRLSLEMNPGNVNAENIVKTIDSL